MRSQLLILAVLVVSIALGAKLFTSRQPVGPAYERNGLPPVGTLPRVSLPPDEGLEKARNLPGRLQASRAHNPFSNRGVGPRAQELYKSCAGCHGSNGHGQLPDLRSLSSYKCGAGDRAIYRSIQYGVPNPTGLQHQFELNEQDAWELVNLLRAMQTVEP